MAQFRREMSSAELAKSVSEFLAERNGAVDRQNGGEINPYELQKGLESRGIICTTKEMVAALTSIKDVDVRINRGLGQNSVLLVFVFCA